MRLDTVPVDEDFYFAHCRCRARVIARRVKPRGKVGREVHVLLAETCKEHASMLRSLINIHVVLDGNIAVRNDPLAVELQDTFSPRDPYSCASPS